MRTNYNRYVSNRHLAGITYFGRQEDVRILPGELRPLFISKHKHILSKEYSSLYITCSSVSNVKVPDYGEFSIVVSGSDHRKCPLANKLLSLPGIVKIGYYDLKGYNSVFMSEFHIYYFNRVSFNEEDLIHKVDTDAPEESNKYKDKVKELPRSYLLAIDTDYFMGLKPKESIRQTEVIRSVIDQYDIGCPTVNPHAELLVYSFLVDVYLATCSINSKLDPKFESMGIDSLFNFVRAMEVIDNTNYAKVQKLVNRYSKRLAIGDFKARFYTSLSILIPINNNDIDCLAHLIHKEEKKIRKKLKSSPNNSELVLLNKLVEMASIEYV